MNGNYTKKVRMILDKGDEITLSELEYLIDREVERGEIAKSTGFSTKELRIFYNKFKQAKASRKTKKRKEIQVDLLTVEVYNELKGQKQPDKLIAETYGIPETSLYTWKIAMGITKADVGKLTPSTYRKLRIKGVSDAQMRRKYGIATYILQGWRDFHFTPEELEEMKNEYKRNVRYTRKPRQKNTKTSP